MPRIHMVGSVVAGKRLLSRRLVMYIGERRAVIDIDIAVGCDGDASVVQLQNMVHLIVTQSVTGIYPGENALLRIHPEHGY